MIDVRMFFVPSVAALTICSGCGVLTGISSSYPNRWPTISEVTTKDCSHLTGRYRDFGVYSYLPEDQASYLTYRLASAEASISEPSSGPEISVRGVAQDGSVFWRTFRLAAARVECRDGTLLVPPKVTSQWDGPAGYRAQRRLALRKAVNGDLIGEDSLFSVGHFLIVPVAGGQTYWYWWQQVEQ
jgi:hypothetical protein